MDLPMNNFPTATIIDWETRNWGYDKKVLVWCKDYGLKPITRHVFVGLLYPRERTEIGSKLKGILSAKADKYFVVTICKMCFNGSMLSVDYGYREDGCRSFELVQMTN